MVVQQGLEVTWEEIAAHAGELTGKRVKLILDTDAPQASVQPNFKMLEAMRATEEIQQGMDPKPDSDAVAIIREGRQGLCMAMLLPISISCVVMDANARNAPGVGVHLLP